MANRDFFAAQYTLERDPVVLWAKIAIGSTGAPTITRAKGIKSIERTATGDYTVTFGVPSSQTDTYARILNFKGGATAVGDDIGVPFVALVSDSASTGTATLTCFAADGTTPADPTSGCSLFLEFVLQNSAD